jgi:farnesol dehydrogenase
MGSLSMVVLLTGATGFLGKHIMHELAEFDLRIISRTAKIEGVEVVNADITKGVPSDAFEDVEAVIHTAAKVDNWPLDLYAGYYQTNVEATENLVKQALAFDIDRIIYTSSYFALGSTGELVVDENWDNPDDFHHPYTKSKYLAGKRIDPLMERYPDRITQLLPTVGLGAGIDNVVIHTLIDYINGRLPGIPGGGNTSMNFVDARDVAIAHRLALDGPTGKYIIGAHNRTLAEFMGMFAERLDIAPPRSLPFWMAKVYAKMLHLTRSPRLTTADIAVSQRNWQYHSDKAKALGYHPRGLDELVETLLKTMVDEKKLSKKGMKRVETYLSRS